MVFLEDTILSSFVGFGDFKEGVEAVQRRVSVQCVECSVMSSHLSALTALSTDI